MSLQLAFPLGTIASLILSMSCASATTWHITPEGTGDAPTIQAGVDLAVSGDTILLAPGVFTGPGNKNVNFSGKDILVTSDAGPASTTIDCEGADRAFLLVMGETSAAAISGITVRHGNPGATGFPAGGAILCVGSSATITGCVFDDNVGGGSIGGGGGAVFCSNSPSVTIDDCVFTENSVNTTDGLGGGVSLFHSSATVSRCTFEENSTLSTQFAGGGGLFAWFGSSVDISDCTFRKNSSETGGGFCLVETATASIANCEFVGNSAVGSAGGICISGNSFSLTDCVFLGNQSRTGGGAQWSSNGIVLRCVFRNNTALVDGGGTFASVSSSTVQECVFANNSASRGGGAAVVDALVSFENCTFSQNAAATGGNLFVRRIDSPAHADLTNTILSFADGPSATCLGGGTTSLACSDVFGNSGGDWVGCLSGQQNLNGNFSADPLFCGAESGDFSIRSDSPCAPPGVTGCGLVGALPVGCGPISLEELTWGEIKGLYR